MKCKYCGEEYSENVIRLHENRCNEKEVGVDEDADSSNSDIELVNADDYSVKELKQICRDEDLSGYSRKNQDELVEMINDHRRSDV